MIVEGVSNVNSSANTTLSAPKSDEDFANFFNMVVRGISQRAKTEQDFYWFMIEVYDFLKNRAGTEEVLSGFHLYDLEYRGSKSEDSYPGERNAAAAYVREDVLDSLTRTYGDLDANLLLALTYILFIGQNSPLFANLRVKFASHYQNNCLTTGSFENAKKWAEIADAAANQIVELVSFEGRVPWSKNTATGANSAATKDTCAEASEQEVKPASETDVILRGLCKIISKYGSAQISDSRSLLSGKKSNHISGIINDVEFKGMVYEPSPAVSIHLRADIHDLRLTDDQIAFWNLDNRFTKMYRQDAAHTFLTLDAFVTAEDKGRIANSIIRMWDAATKELPNFKQTYELSKNLEEQLIQIR